MKKYLIIFALFLLASCGARKSTVHKERIKIFETSEITRKAPADRIYIELPKTPNERPKATTKVFKGEKGATTEVTFDSVGIVTKIVTDCPEVDELEKRNRELTKVIKDKEVERKSFPWVWIVVSGLVGLLVGIARPWKLI